MWNKKSCLYQICKFDADHINYFLKVNGMHKGMLISVQYAFSGINHVLTWLYFRNISKSFETSFNTDISIHNLYDNQVKWLLVSLRFKSMIVIYSVDFYIHIRGCCSYTGHSYFITSIVIINWDVLLFLTGACEDWIIASHKYIVYITMCIALYSCHSVLMWLSVCMNANSMLVMVAVSL